MFSSGLVPFLRQVSTFRLEPRTSWMISVCCRSSSSGKQGTGRGYPVQPYRRVKSRDKDPFGFFFGRRFPRPESMTCPNLIFEERMRSQAAATSQPGNLPQQNFDYFLVLDFEATCDKPIAPIPQEIIEFPVVKVDARTMEPVATFHQYVSPTVHPQLTPFCTKLTGIIQDMVDNQPPLETVLRLFHGWMEKEGLLKPDIRFSFITCGDWDLGEMLPQQAKHFKLFLPAYFNNWINAKHAFSEVIGHYPRSLMLMLESLGIEQTGRAHSGIDDCKNIVQVVQNLAKRGHIFRTSGETKNLKTVKFVRR